MDRLIVALDVPSADEALAVVTRLGDAVGFYKVGLELFTAAGPAMVKQLVDRGKQVFLDLKVHDIPNTVAGATRSAAALGASLLTLHGGGGRAMMEAAAAARAGTGLQLLAVTVLTSLGADDLAADGNPLTIAELVERRARLAVACGVDGVVCSPLEAAAARAIVGATGLVVTPGVRAAGPRTDDQQRTATAREARAAGASHVVVGRPILKAADPIAAATALRAELE